MQEWLGGRRQGSSATGTSRATRPISASDSRTRRASISTSGSTRRSATSRSLKNYFDSGKRRRTAMRRSFDEFLADPTPSRYHFIGKDIVYFHTLFWPAMLHFAGSRKAPTNVYVHGFITVSGEKMSKSRGTGISPQRYLEARA